MHPSELYAVCEPRVYCSPVLRQGCCNALTMEIQIVHPLAQLPAARDLRCYYCPLLCPYFNGEAVRSPKRCTMMWTVSTCDIVRDIRIMAALDEHVDFNHWTVFYGVIGGNVAQPYVEVQLDVLLPEGEQSSIPPAGEVDDPDAEDSIVTSMLPIEAQIQSLNLLPDLETDVDPLNNFYTVLADETADHSGAVEFIEQEVQVGNDGSPSTPLGPEFECVSATTTTLQPIANIEATPEYGWHIEDNDEYASASEYWDFVSRKYAKERNFEVRRDSTNKEFPKSVPRECYPPDGIYTQLIVCVLGGSSRTKKESVPAEKRRNRKSLKLGCTWRTRGRWNYLKMKYVVSLASEEDLEHTNGCNPSPQQQLISITKKTKGKIGCIPVDVEDEIRVLFEEGQAISFIRLRIRNRIPLHIKTDARWFVMLRKYFEREKISKHDCNGQQQPAVSTNPNPDMPPPMISDAVVIPTVMRSIIGPILRLQGLPVLQVLEKLRREVPGFMYN